MTELKYILKIELMEFVSLNMVYEREKSRKTPIFLE